jgi:hypothetical protein
VIDRQKETKSLERLMRQDSGSYYFLADQTSGMWDQDGHEWFHCREKGASYLLTLLDRLKSLSDLSVRELLTNRSSALRCHPIDWDGTSEAGFRLPNEEQLVDTPYQFSLSANEHGRVHGFFIDEVFYIVWLDPDHLLYPGKG